MQQIIESVDPAEAAALADILPDITWIKVCGVDQRANQAVCNIRAASFRLKASRLQRFRSLRPKAATARW